MSGRHQAGCHKQVLAPGLKVTGGLRDTADMQGNSGKQEATAKDTGNKQDTTPMLMRNTIKACINNNNSTNNQVIKLALRLHESAVVRYESTSVNGESEMVTSLPFSNGQQ